VQQLLLTWLGIDTRKRIIVGVATVAMFAAILALSRIATQPGMALLYSGLDPTSAGEVVAALDQQNVEYDIRGSAIYVDASRRDQLRMVLAGEGLPASNGQGYELLDSLSGFGTTAQMFDAAYWRAKEGELARTIVAGLQFRDARVHLSNTPSSPFRRGTAPTASVTVTARSGSVSPGNARALKYLVSSAVTGLSPEDVAVIDGRNGTVVSDSSGLENSGSADERTQELKRNVERLLEARVGRGNVIVELNVDTTTQSETLFERRLDPDSRVAISTRKEERTNNSTNSGGNSVTVASNLPQGDVSGAGKSSASDTSETNETVNFEVSETTREISRLPGAIRRLSVAVLVNDLRREDPETGDAGWVERSPDELSSLHDLVASAVGFDPERGDTITLKSMPFEPIPQVGTAATTSVFQQLNLDVMRLVQLAVLTLVSVVLGLFVLRPILTAPASPALPAPTNPQSLPGVGASLPASSPNALTGLIDNDDPNSTSQLPPEMALVTADTGPRELNTIQSGGSDSPVDRLRDLIADRQDETVEILKSWIDEKEEDA